MHTPTNILSSAGATDRRRAILRRRGFTPSAGGWRCDHLGFCEEDGWLVFTTPAPEITDPLRDLGAPGLWKIIYEGQETRRVFAVSKSWIPEDAWLETEEERSGFDAVLEWMMATEGRTLPQGWTVPEKAMLDRSLEKSRLTLVHRSFTRQMHLLHASAQLALRLPILSAVPVDLSAARLRWLRILLLEAQNAHHLFRLGFAEDGSQTSVIAEIDLTGVPSMLLEPLLSKSCDALRWVTSRLIESATFLSQADVASRALEKCAVPQPNP